MPDELEVLTARLQDAERKLQLVEARCNELLALRKDVKCKYDFSDAAYCFLKGVQEAVKRLGEPETPERILEFAHAHHCKVPWLYDFLNSIPFLWQTRGMSQEEVVDGIFHSLEGKRIGGLRLRSRSSTCSDIACWTVWEVLEEDGEDPADALSEAKLQARSQRFKEVNGHSPEEFLRLYRSGEIPSTLNNTLSFSDALFLAGHEVG